MKHTTEKEGQTMASQTRLTSIEEAIDFLKSQGFQINHVDGIYRVRKEGWEKRPYEVNAETLIQQANLLRNKTA